MGASQSQHKATDIYSYQEEQTKPVPIARKLPYNYVNIIKEADSRPSNLILTDNIYFNFLLIEEFCEHLYHGVFLNGKRKKYWIEKESGYNCFMLYARDLNIYGSDDTDRWKWSNVIEASSSDGDIFIGVAELLIIWRMKIEGKFNTSNLSPNTMYEILFVMLNDLSMGWEAPVNIILTLKLPNGETKEHKETLLEKPKGQLVELQVGEFFTSPHKIGEMHFYMILNDPSFGWEIPVSFSLTHLDEETKGHKETLENSKVEWIDLDEEIKGLKETLENPKVEWMELGAEVGKFYTSPNETREMKFSKTEQPPTYKRGLTIKGVIIRPSHV